MWSARPRGAFTIVVSMALRRNAGGSGEIRPKPILNRVLGQMQASRKHSATTIFCRLNVGTPRQRSTRPITRCRTSKHEVAANFAKRKTKRRRMQTKARNIREVIILEIPTKTISIDVSTSGISGFSQWSANSIPTS